MRRYHVKVTLLALGVVLGFGSAAYRYASGYPLVGPACHEGRSSHHHPHHHDCHCGDEPGVQSGKT